jgi:hypothetical protein
LKYCVRRLINNSILRLFNGFSFQTQIMTFSTHLSPSPVSAAVVHRCSDRFTWLAVAQAPGHRAARAVANVTVAQVAFDTSAAQQQDVLAILIDPAPPGKTSPARRRTPAPVSHQTKPMKRRTKTHKSH